jgi:hypothetical protein
MKNVPKLQEKPPPFKKEPPEVHNMKFLNFFLFVGHFCPHGSGSGPSRPKSMRIPAASFITGNAQYIVRDWIRIPQKSWGLTNRKYLAASSARDLPMPVLAPVIHTT